MNVFTGEPLFHSGQELRQHLRALIEGSSRIDIASAWLSNSVAAELLAGKDAKTAIRMVVGVGGYHTDPTALKKLGSQPHISLKVHGDATSVPLFHPKLYVFQHAHFRRMLIGSMNLTKAGAETNVESMFSVEDKQKRADQEFERFWTNEEAVPYADFPLADYEVNRRKMLAAIKDVGAAGVLGSDIVASAESKIEIDVLKEGWKTFVSELESSQNGIDDSLRVLRARHGLVDRNWSKDLSQSDLDIMFGNAPFYAFGHLMAVKQSKFMGDGEGREKRLQLGAAVKAAMNLTHLNAPIVEGVVRQLLDIPQVGAALATRLLVLARPDFFVVVNKKSFEGLGKRFDLPVSYLRFEAASYVKLLQKIHATEWYRSPEPEGTAAQELWQARAALIDPLVYKDKPGESAD